MHPPIDLVAQRPDALGQPWIAKDLVQNDPHGRLDVDHVSCPAVGRIDEYAEHLFDHGERTAGQRRPDPEILFFTRRQ